MLVEEQLGDAQKGSHILQSNETHITCLLEGGPEIHQGLGKSRIADLGRTMQDRNFVIAFEESPTIRFEDSPNADHSKRLQFDGAKGTHARRTEKRRFPWRAPKGFPCATAMGRSQRGRR